MLESRARVAANVEGGPMLFIVEDCFGFRWISQDFLNDF